MGELPWLYSAEGRSIAQLLALEGTYRMDSIVCVVEQGIGQRRGLTEAEKVVLAIAAVEREVNNGGFSQFFFNSSRVYAYEAAGALRAIGAPKTAELFEKALALVTSGKKVEVDNLRLCAAEASDEVDDGLDDLDAEYYAGVEEPLSEKLFQYIKRNQADIRTAA